MDQVVANVKRMTAADKFNNRKLYNYEDYHPELMWYCPSCDEPMFKSGYCCKHPRLEQIAVLCADSKCNIVCSDFKDFDKIHIKCLRSGQIDPKDRKFNPKNNIVKTEPTFQNVDILYSDGNRMNMNSMDNMINPFGDGSHNNNMINPFGVDHNKNPFIITEVINNQHSKYEMLHSNPNPIIKSESLIENNNNQNNISNGQHTHISEYPNLKNIVETEHSPEIKIDISNSRKRPRSQDITNSQNKKFCTDKVHWQNKLNEMPLNKIIEEFAELSRKNEDIEKENKALRGDPDDINDFNLEQLEDIEKKYTETLNKIQELKKKKTEETEQQKNCTIL